MLTGIQHSNHFLTDIVRGARDGSLALPAFQRGWAWEEADVIALLDSLWRGYPIGYLLFWGDCRRHVDANCMRGFRGGSSPDKYAALVLDGQQRIQALIDATGPTSGYCFDVASDRFIRTDKPDLISGEMPCRLLLESLPLYQALRPLYERKAYELTNVMERVSAAFRDARIGSILIPPEKDEVFARGVFRRLNTSGKPFSEDEVFQCLRKP